MQEQSKIADWLSFVLHFVVGLFLGCVVGCILIIGRRQEVWLKEEMILPFLIGTSLLCGGIASRYGDRLWVGDRYRVIAPNEIKHNRISISLSYAFVVVGSAFILISLYGHFL